MSDQQTVSGAVEQATAGQTGGSDCGFPSHSERQSNNDPQGLHSSTGSVDNSRPPMSRLTAKTLRMAHSKVMNIHRLGGLVPEGLAMLERDYKAWKRRVQRGTQRETLIVVPWSAEVRQP